MRLSAFFAFLALAFLSSVGNATVAEPLTVAELARRAPLVAHVRVVDQRVVDERGRILTYTTLRVLDGIQGVQNGAALVLVQPGGHLAGRVSGVVGQPHYAVGDEVVLFLAPYKRAGRDVVVHVTLGQGVFDVVKVGSTRALVERTDSEVALLTPDGRLVPARPRRFGSVAALRAAMGQP